LVPDMPKLAAGTEITTVQTFWRLVHQWILCSTNHKIESTLKQRNSWKTNKFPRLISFFGYRGGQMLTKSVNYFVQNTNVLQIPFKFPTILLFTSMSWAWMEKNSLGN